MTMTVAAACVTCDVKMKQKGGCDGGGWLGGGDCGWRGGVQQRPNKKKDKLFFLYLSVFFVAHTHGASRFLCGPHFGSFCDMCTLRCPFMLPFLLACFLGQFVKTPSNGVSVQILEVFVASNLENQKLVRAHSGGTTLFEYL